jgi:hypothetical protein
MWPKQSALLPAPELDYLASLISDLRDDDEVSVMGVTVFIGPFWVSFIDEYPPCSGFLVRWFRKHERD